MKKSIQITYIHTYLLIQKNKISKQSTHFSSPMQKSTRDIYKMSKDFLKSWPYRFWIRHFHFSVCGGIFNENTIFAKQIWQLWTQGAFMLTVLSAASNQQNVCLMNTTITAKLNWGKLRIKEESLFKKPGNSQFSLNSLRFALNLPFSRG